MAKYSTLDVSKGSECASYQWLHVRILHKYLGRQGWGSWCFFLMSYSCCSRCTTELPWTCAQSGNIQCKATELKHLVLLFYSVLELETFWRYSDWCSASVEIAMNSCYDSNLLQLIFLLIRSPLRDNKKLCKVQLFIRRKLTSNHWNKINTDGPYVHIPFK